MDSRRKVTSIIGIVTLIAVVLILLTSPNLLFSPLATFIDTELYRSSGNEVSVRTKTDFGSQEHMAAFPREIGKWSGYDYDTTEYIELLGADLMVLRRYEPDTFSQPIFLLIMQAQTESSFHPPDICVRAQGYEIHEEAQEEIILTEATWVKESSSTSIPMRKLVNVKKSQDGKLMERRVLLFCYVKGNQFYTDTITMIQVDALVPLEGSYEGVLKEEKDFLANAIPLMFEPSQEIILNPIYMALIELGITGYLIITLLLFIPLTIIFIPLLLSRKGVTNKPEIK